jgi:hypothetical protein
MIGRKPHTTIWAILSVDKDGNEGICAIEPGIPCMTADPENLEMMKALCSTVDAREEAEESGFKIVIAEFIRGKTVRL